MVLPGVKLAAPQTPTSPGQAPAATETTSTRPPAAHPIPDQPQAQRDSLLDDRTAAYESIVPARRGNLLVMFCPYSTHIDKRVSQPRRIETDDSTMAAAAIFIRSAGQYTTRRRASQATARAAHLKSPAISTTTTVVLSSAHSRLLTPVSTISASAPAALTNDDKRPWTQASSQSQRQSTLPLPSPFSPNPRPLPCFDSHQRTPLPLNFQTDEHP